jgi:ribosomal protein S18 acetylase RimI-like enzyme
MIRDLEPPDVARVIALADELTAVDGARVPESLGMLGTDVWAVAAWDRERPIGFASVYQADRPEIGLGVEPAHRRRGLGRRLLEHVLARLSGAREALMICERRSEPGLAMLRAIGAEHRYSEFRLERHGGELPASRPDITVRRAGPDDRATLIELLARSFGDPPDEAARRIDATLRETDRTFAIASLRGTPVGCVRLGVWDGIGDITALGVLPEQRGAGIGQAVLAAAVVELEQLGHQRIALEVETTNHRALALYQRCGFVVGHEFLYSAIATGPST